MQCVPLSQAFSFLHPHACFDVSGNVQDATRASPSRVTTRAHDLENNIFCLILLSDRGGLQQYMWFCKLQSVLHKQHENKVLNPGLSVQQIATHLEIC